MRLRPPVRRLYGSPMRKQPFMDRHYLKVDSYSPVLLDVSLLDPQNPLGSEIKIPLPFRRSPCFLNGHEHILRVCWQGTYAPAARIGYGVQNSGCSWNIRHLTNTFGAIWP